MARDRRTPSAHRGVLGRHVEVHVPGAQVDGLQRPLHHRAQVGLREVEHHFATVEATALEQLGDQPVELGDVLLQPLDAGLGRAVVAQQPPAAGACGSAVCAARG